VEDPHQEVKIGEKLLAKILRVDTAERKIGLSKKRADWSAEQEGAAEKRPKARRGGLHGPGEETTALIPAVELKPPADLPPLGSTTDTDEGSEPQETAESEDGEQLDAEPSSPGDPS
jgi:small subunit ribosomal protein S1